MFTTMLFSNGFSIHAKAQNSNDQLNQIYILTKEELISLGLPTETILLKKDNELRKLLPGEKVQVQTHEEDNSISFTTFDHFSIRLNKNQFQAPRNISG